MVIRKQNIKIAVNVFVGIMSWLSWMYMAFWNRNVSALSTHGISSLKYFTVLSNLLNGTVSFLYAYVIWKGIAIQKSGKCLKLIATAAVGLTFVTVMVFLGPLYGYASMFKGANLWMHLILPVLSMLSFVILEEDCHVSLRDTVWVMLFPFVYEIGYVMNIVINGKGEWPDSNDFYAFLNWGNGVGAVIALTILLVTWFVGVMLNQCGKMIGAKNQI